MQQWAAISIVVIMGLFLLVQLIIMYSFGGYNKLLRNTHREMLDLRLNMARQKNDEAALAILHRRRHDDPPPEQETA
jgi:hypothetical protein